nr:hypothetical protein [Bacillus pumilus]
MKRDEKKNQEEKNQSVQTSSLLARVPRQALLAVFFGALSGF